MFVNYCSSDFGTWKIMASHKGVLSIGLSHEETLNINPNAHTNLAAKELQEYFNGKRMHFESRVDLEGHPPFYKQVWKILIEVPYGKTCSYKDLATKLNNLKAVRAVGMANGKNPVAIMIPCHRVIGTDGSMTGYAYGIDLKKQLLVLENPKRRSLQGNLFD